MVVMVIVVDIVGCLVPVASSPTPPTLANADTDTMDEVRGHEHPIGLQEGLELATDEALHGPLLGNAHKGPLQTGLLDFAVQYRVPTLQAEGQTVS